ncbi:hypothetical protein [Halobacillus amylolyticus]|uniref:DUF4367 domain-containing protein n=1 Tax=Halobacillus amylolyticus TaxID=2932259 RepID=A0ABY4HHL6_9BACI|nr:hypothetical protein [Halobacillus amylolyticus]UOR14177.1 hypothetical protein MUO15_21060 [Halobacillus amylolyticus]
MKKGRKILLCSLLLFLMLSNTGYANKKDEGSIESEEPMTTEELYKSMGYTKAEKAVQKYENKFDTNINFPKVMPFQAKLQFGKIEDNRLTLEFIGESKKQLFKIHVEPSNSTKQLTNKKLKDGTEVFIKHVGPNPNKPSISWLHLKRDNQKYGLGLNYYKKDVRQDKLIKAAESLQ